jgi:hypothetical protein
VIPPSDVWSWGEAETREVEEISAASAGGQWGMESPSVGRYFEIE